MGTNNIMDKQSVKLISTCNPDRLSLHEWLKSFCTVPQGSILGALLFYIHMLSLGQINHRYNINFHCYADDMQLHFPLSGLMLWLVSLISNAGCHTSSLGSMIPNLRFFYSVPQNWPVTWKRNLETCPPIPSILPEMWVSSMTQLYFDIQIDKVAQSCFSKSIFLFYTLVTPCIRCTAKRPSPVSTSFKTLLSLLSSHWQPVRYKVDFKLVLL